MRVYGFGEGLIAKATQPRQTSKDEQIAQLRAEVERLQAAMEACGNALVLVAAFEDIIPERIEELRKAYGLTRAALGKGAA